jgi:hypothetical protein
MDSKLNILLYLYSFHFLFRPLGSATKGGGASSGIRAPPATRPPPIRTTAPPVTKPPVTKPVQQQQPPVPKVSLATQRPSPPIQHHNAIINDHQHGVHSNENVRLQQEVRFGFSKEFFWI